VLLEDAVGLRALGLGAGMIDVLEREEEFVLVVFGIAAMFRALPRGSRHSFTSRHRSRGSPGHQADRPR